MLQSIINHIYRYPLSKIKLYQRFGGYAAYKRMLAGSREMELAAWQLPAVTSFESGLPVYFLTGQKYAYQTLFCITSLQKVTSAQFNFILVDDGSFDDDLTKRIVQQLPGVSIIKASDIDVNLNKVLPEDKYPFLRAKRNIYPHLKKLTDVHTLPGHDWKLVLDSDMLFWKEPTKILQWLKTTDRPLHMLDCLESYGYSTSLMKDLCGHQIPELLNVGAIGLNSKNINWDDLERWAINLETAGGTSYYLEQALTAMLIAGQPATVLGANSYRVNPVELNDGSALHHYVDLSKKIYFGQAWKKIR